MTCTNGIRSYVHGTAVASFLTMKIVAKCTLIIVGVTVYVYILSGVTMYVQYNYSNSSPASMSVKLPRYFFTHPFRI